MTTLPSLPPELPTPGSWSSTTSNVVSAALSDPKTLVLHHGPEVLAAVLEVMFTIRRIDQELLEITPASVNTHIRRNLLIVDGGSKVAEDERRIQNLARELFDSLEALDARSGEQAFELDVKHLYEDESLVFLLASEVSRKAVRDDAIMAEAIEYGGNLPTTTMCQTLLQAADFGALLRRENPDLGSVDRCEIVIWALVKQFHVDANRESFTRKNGGSNVNKTNCQVLFEHNYFKTLFGTMKSSYYKNACPEPVLDWRMPWVGSKRSTMNTELPRVECVGCCDAILPLDGLQASCDHYFCEGCVVMLAGICVKDESSFPMKCCKQPLKPSDVTPFLDQNLRMLYAAAGVEFGTPAGDRLYCPQPKCSAFLGSVADLGSRHPDGTTLTPCQKCHTAVCQGCKEKAHPGESCQENKEIQMTRKLAKELNWKACPKCRAIVEKRDGCNHMVCRCSEQFCYGCGALWRPRTCNC